MPKSPTLLDAYQRSVKFQRRQWKSSDAATSAASIEFKKEFGITPSEAFSRFGQDALISDIRKSLDQEASSRKEYVDAIAGKSPDAKAFGEYVDHKTSRGTQQALDRGDFAAAYGLHSEHKRSLVPPRPPIAKTKPGFIARVKPVWDEAKQTIVSGTAGVAANIAGGVYGAADSTYKSAISPLITQQLRDLEELKASGAQYAPPDSELIGRRWMSPRLMEAQLRGGGGSQFRPKREPRPIDQAIDSARRLVAEVGPSPMLAQLEHAELELQKKLSEGGFADNLWKDKDDVQRGVKELIQFAVNWKETGKEGEGLWASVAADFEKGKEFGGMMAAGLLGMTLHQLTTRPDKQFITRPLTTLLTLLPVARALKHTKMMQNPHIVKAMGYAEVAEAAALRGATSGALFGSFIGDTAAFAAGAVIPPAMRLVFGKAWAEAAKRGVVTPGAVAEAQQRWKRNLIDQAAAENVEVSQVYESLAADPQQLAMTIRQAMNPASGEVARGEARMASPKQRDPSMKEIPGDAPGPATLDPAAPVAAYDRQTRTFQVNEARLRQTYDNRAWRNPLPGVAALPEGVIRSLDDWRNFNRTRQFVMAMSKRNPEWTPFEYQNKVNQWAVNQLLRERGERIQKPIDVWHDGDGVPNFVETFEWDPAPKMLVERPQVGDVGPSAKVVGEIKPEKKKAVVVGTSQPIYVFGRKVTEHEWGSKDFIKARESVRSKDGSFARPYVLEPPPLDSGLVSPDFKKGAADLRKRHAELLSKQKEFQHMFTAHADGRFDLTPSPGSLAGKRKTKLERQLEEYNQDLSEFHFSMHEFEITAQAETRKGFVDTGDRVLDMKAREKEGPVAANEDVPLADVKKLEPLQQAKAKTAPGAKQTRQRSVRMDMPDFSKDPAAKPVWNELIDALNADVARTGRFSDENYSRFRDLETRLLNKGAYKSFSRRRGPGPMEPAPLGGIRTEVVADGVSLPYYKRMDGGLRRVFDIESDGTVLPVDADKLEPSRPKPPRQMPAVAESPHLKAGVDIIAERLKRSYGDLVSVDKKKIAAVFGSVLLDDAVTLLKGESFRGRVVGILADRMGLKGKEARNLYKSLSDKLFQIARDSFDPNKVQSAEFRVDVGHTGGKADSAGRVVITLEDLIFEAVSTMKKQGKTKLLDDARARALQITAEGFAQKSERAQYVIAAERELRAWSKDGKTVIPVDKVASEAIRKLEKKERLPEFIHADPELVAQQILAIGKKEWVRAINEGDIKGGAVIRDRYRKYADTIRRRYDDINFDFQELVADARDVMGDGVANWTRRQPGAPGEQAGRGVVWVTQGANDVVQKQLRFVRTYNDARSLVLSVERFLKKNVVPRNPRSYANNIGVNYMIQSLARVGGPLLMGKVVNDGLAWRRYTKGLMSKSDPRYEWFQALSKKNFVDNSWLEGELGTLYSGRGTLDFLADKLRGLPGGDWSAKAILKWRKALDAVDSGYKYGDTIFRVEDAIHQMKRVNSFADGIELGIPMELELKHGSVTVMKTAGGWFVDGKPASREDLQSALASYAVEPGHKKFFDYNDLPTMIKRIKTSTAGRALASPFLIWLWKSFDVPGVKKGLGSAIFEGPGKIKTESAFVNRQLAKEQAALGLTRAMLLNSMQANLDENREIASDVHSHVKGDRQLVLTDLATNPLSSQVRVFFSADIAEMTKAGWDGAQSILMWAYGMPSERSRLDVDKLPKGKPESFKDYLYEFRKMQGENPERMRMKWGKEMEGGHAKISTFYKLALMEGGLLLNAFMTGDKRKTVAESYAELSDFKKQRGKRQLLLSVPGNIMFEAIQKYRQGDNDPQSWGRFVVDQFAGAGYREGLKRDLALDYLKNIETALKESSVRVFNNEMAEMRKKYSELPADEQPGRGSKEYKEYVAIMRKRKRAQRLISERIAFHKKRLLTWMPTLEQYEKAQSESKK